MVQQRFVKVMAVALVALLLSGCMAVPITSGGETTPTPVVETQHPPAAGPEADAAIELATQTLLAQLGVLDVGVEVVSIEEVQWSSSALGCPAPDGIYLQVIVPGYKVVLQLNGQDYAVHVGGENAVVCSDEGTPMELTMVQPEQNVDAIIAQAKADLAQRLSVGLEQIELVKSEAVQWRSSGLGCEQPGGRYLTVIVPGSLVVLKAGGSLYEYHTGGGRVVLCTTTPDSR